MHRTFGKRTRIGPGCMIGWIIAIGLATTAAPLYATTIVESQNFESYSANEDLLTAGWLKPFGGSGSLTTTAPAGTGDNSTLAATTSSAYQQYGAAFSSPNTLTASDTSIIVSGWVRGTAATASNGFSIGQVGVNTAIILGRIGMYSVSNVLYFEYNGVFSTDTVTVGHWYDMQLRITVNTATPASSTASLYVRDITAGDSSYHIPTGLGNLTVALNGTRAPQNWTSWYVRGINGQIDNLAVTIPEPATLMLTCIGGLMVIRRRSVGRS